MDRKVRVRMSKQDKPENCNQASNEAHCEVRSGERTALGLENWLMRSWFPLNLSGRPTPESRVPHASLGSNPSALTRFGISRDMFRGSLGQLTVSSFQK